MPQAVPAAASAIPASHNRAERRVAKHKNKNPLRPRFVSILEACDYLSVSRAKFYADLLSRVKTVKVGRRNLVDLESLDELADVLLAGG
jgi:hypothetical protein